MLKDWRVDEHGDTFHPCGGSGCGGCRKGEDCDESDSCTKKDNCEGGENNETEEEDI